MASRYGRYGYRRVTALPRREGLEILKAQCGNERSKKNLKIIHAVCREQHRRSSKDFSLSTIGELSEDEGGTKYGTIRATHEQSQRFRTLIEAWAKYSNGATKKSEVHQAPKKDSLAQQLAKLPDFDPALVALVGKLETDAKRPLNALNLLKSKSEIIIDRRENALPQPTGNQPQVLPAITLNDIEREALEEALSDVFLADQGWSIDEVGRVKNNNGRTVFKAGFAIALRKTLDS